MKKLILIVTAFLGLSVGSASATCTSPAVMHDFPGTAFNMSLGTTPDGNCGSNILITTWGGVALGAPSNYGTSPGAVAVPGVNAFITNTPAFNQTQLNSVALGSPSNYGTSPGAVAVQGVNAFVTNFPATQPVSAASLPLPSGAATAALQGTNTATTAHTCSVVGFSEVGCLGQIDDDVKGPIAAGTNTIGTTGQLPYPVGAVPITASATGTTAATTATLAGTTGKTTYVCGYSIRANATANANVTNTLTGVISGTLSSIMWVPANTAGLGVDEQIFQPCIPASAANTAISAVSGAPGTGGLVSSKIWGFQL